MGFDLIFIAHFFAILLLGLGLLALVAFYRLRRERRLAAGGKLAPNDSRLVKHLNNFALILGGVWFGAMLSESWHVSSDMLFWAYMILILLIPRDRWVVPGAPENANEPGARAERQ